MDHQKPIDSEVLVWDVLIRLFHWILVSAFVLAYLSAEELMVVHTYAGYTIGGLLGFRIIWGFVGPRYARFSNFIYSPQAIGSYLKDTLLLRNRRFIGHNPAGGAMIFLMLFSLIFTVLTGLATYGAEEHAGPLASWFLHSGDGEMWEDVHEFFANATVVLILGHIAGVVFESLLHRENLVRSMINGRKAKNAS